jgi:hypothetical protein
MRFPSPILAALSAAAVAALVAGCSAGSAIAPKPATPAGLGSIGQSGVKHYAVLSAIPKGFVIKNTRQNLKFVAPNTIPGGLYVSAFTATAINEYKIPNKLNGAPKCTDGPSSAPNGINVDSHRTLWDPDGGTRTIIPFAPNCGGAGTALSDPNGQPADVAFDGTKMYVADVSGAVDVFTSGVLTGQLTNPAITGSSFGVAVIQHNVFLSSTANVIVEFAGGLEPGAALALTGTSVPGGITGDQHHNLIVTDLGNGFLVYAPPYSGAPIKTQAWVGASVYAHLDKTHEFLYAGDFANGSADVYTYPGLHYKYSVTNGLIQSQDVEGVGVDFIGSN